MLRAKPDGSPPRAWGQLLDLVVTQQFNRFTPTCVGTTSTRPVKRPILPVHPHVRGDNQIGHDAVGPAAGSPPRAWGQRRTPALCRPTKPVHPHVRGDNCSRRSPASARFGSPPRAWGQLGGFTLAAPIFRFTPTCVGTTSRSPASTAPLTVHPHVRGDNEQTGKASSCRPGSPPRAWGQQPASSSGPGRGRFTPTCVGTTRSNEARHGSLTVHPHVRGDNFPVNGRDTSA